MPFDTHARRALLREHAADYVRVALTNIAREYPHMPYFVSTRPGDYHTHRELHPVFYGCFDWHSAVEMHWVVVRLLRCFSDLGADDVARRTLDDQLTPHRTLERPYGWGWLLTLQHELLTWDD